MLRRIILITAAIIFILLIFAGIFSIEHLGFWPILLAVLVALATAVGFYNDLKGLLEDLLARPSRARSPAPSSPLRSDPQRMSTPSNLTDPPSCFIAHSSDDRAFTDRLHADLHAANVDAWYFETDAQEFMGRTEWSVIGDAIAHHGRLLLVCSRNSLTSGPVLRELSRALAEEDKALKQGNQQRTNILFPITIDRYVFDTWQHERKQDVLDKIVGDFIGWDQDPAKYTLALGRLVANLHSGQPSASSTSALSSPPDGVRAQITGLKAKLERQLDELPHIVALDLNHPDTNQWCRTTKRYLRKLDQILPGDDWEVKYDLIPWHPPNGLAEDKEQRMIYTNACNSVKGLLRDALLKLQE